LVKPCGRKAIKERDWGRHTHILELSLLVPGNAKGKFCMLDMQHAQHKQEKKYLLQNTVGKVKLEDKGKTLDDNFKQTKKKQN